MVSAAPATTGSFGEAHFWVSAFPFFDTTLFVIPRYGDATVRPGESVRSDLLFHDADGRLFNEASVETPGNKVGIIELDQFLGGCKLEAGLKHAHLVVRSRNYADYQFRMHTQDGGAILGAPIKITPDRGTFFPISLSSGRNYLVSFVNCGSSETVGRCRLFVGKRTPETSVVIPGFGARVMSIECEFPEYAKLEEERVLQAYLRVGSKSDQPLGAMLIERAEGRKEGGAFYSVS